MQFAKGADSGHYTFARRRLQPAWPLATSSCVDLEEAEFDGYPKQDIKQYRATNKAAFQSALASYLSAKQAVLEAIKNDESTQSAAATLATAEANLLALRAKQEQYIASLLTGDQVTTWQNFQNKRATRIQNRINTLRQANS